jgi:CBS domain containing-hemolysin-like protein
MKIVYALLALAFVRGIILYKTIHSVPLAELKRRARKGDKKAVAIYKVAGFGDSFDLRQWLFCTAVGTTLFIWSARTSWWLASIFLVITAWLIVWSSFSAKGWPGSLASLFSPFDIWLLSILNPVLSRVAKWLPKNNRVHLHTGLYEKEDLLNLLNKQNRQVDNRIAESDLKIAFGAMTFGDKTVSSIMTPRRKIKIVSADETVGPMLMDELHKTGHSRFPVTKDSPKMTSPKVIGTLYLKEIIDMQAGGKVKDYIRKDAKYVNEDSNLRRALSTFLKTNHHLLIVVNSFEEIVGVISIEDVLEQIIGQPINDEFDEFDSLRAVAAKEAKQEQQKHNEVPVAPRAE